MESQTNRSPVEPESIIDYLGRLNVNHEISGEEFAMRIMPSAGPGLQIPANEMAAIVNAGPFPFLNVIRVDPPASHLNAGIVPVSSIVRAGIYYSYFLFQYILEGIPDSFTFHLADFGGRVIFSVQYPGGAPERFFNLSNMEPIVQPRARALTALRCDDPAHQAYVAGLHSDHDPGIYEEYILNFYGVDNIDDQSILPLDLPWAGAGDPQGISDIMADYPCTNWRLHFLNSDDRTTPPVAPVAEQIPHLSRLVSFVTNYSFMLFKGIRLVTNADRFRFYKAKRGPGDYTIVVMAYAGMAKVGVYDLSNMEP